MRTSGLLLMDTPIPDGRILLTALNPATMQVDPATGIPAITTTNTTADLGYLIDRILMRYGMSDDAQQQFGQGSPSGGFQGAQAQATTTTTPFTTPYGPTGRPPQPSSNYFTPPTSRPKGLKPIALSLGYSVTGVALTTLTMDLWKIVYATGVAPVSTSLITAQALATGLTTYNIARVVIPTNLQQFLTEYDSLTAKIHIVAPSGSTIVVNNAWLDCAVNYN